MLKSLLHTAVFALALSSTAEAHLLHKQDATLNVKGDKGYLAVATPVSAFDGVDLNGDGMLSPSEISEGRGAIKRQFRSRFHVSSEDGVAPIEFAWINNPAESAAASDPEAQTSYVIVMAGAQFSAAPEMVTIITDLFGRDQNEGVLKIRARRGELVEKQILTRGARVAKFFGQ